MAFWGSRIEQLSRINEVNQKQIFKKNTAITNEFTTLQNYAREYFGIKDFYYKAPSLFNARAIEFFYGFLAAHGINEISYYSIRDKFHKDYGFFIK